MNLLIPYLQGLGIGAGLIIAIGAQNAFVLKQGIKKQHRGLIASLCTTIDAVLISLGVAGFGAFFSSHHLLLEIARWGGAAFLGVYGLQSFRAALKDESLKTSDTETAPHSIKKTIAIVLAISLLNPHVYLDTMVLIGTISSQHPLIERPYFALGAITASVLWFFSISFGATFLSPLFKNPKAWKILDSLIGCIMWTIALMLIFEL